MPEVENKIIVDLVSRLGGRSIVLVGMMGCGKTAIGRLMANYFNLPFFDADEEIERAAGMNVTDFFSTYGEAEFRSGETKVISRLLDQNQSVLALGGGAFLSEETRECVAKNALSLRLASC
jgi:shikimate kinase